MAWRGVACIDDGLCRLCRRLCASCCSASRRWLTDMLMCLLCAFVVAGSVHAVLSLAFAAFADRFCRDGVCLLRNVEQRHCAVGLSLWA
jgi:hypothetical protein